MLSTLRGPGGGPSVAVRLLAALVVLGLVVVTAPLFVLPLLHWLVGVALP